MTLFAAPEVTVEQPAGTNLTVGNDIYFGGMQSRYDDPASKVQALDGTFTVTFNGVPKSTFSSYTIQRSASGEDNWQALFAPGLMPDAAGVVRFHDQSPQLVAFYRLFISTDTQRIFTIKNNGTSALTGIGVTLAGTHAASFELDVTATETTLPPGASTPFSVTYIASDTNARKAGLSITGNVPVPFTLTLSGGDISPPVNPPAFSNITITPGGQGTPAGIAGTLTNGAANGSVFLEASSDLGRLDPWSVIDTIPLDAGGNGIFGNPAPITDPGSIGSPHNFYRLRVQ